MKKLGPEKKVRIIDCIKQDPHCTFCSNAPENLTRLFWHCAKVKLFWKDLTDKRFDCEFIPREYTKDMAILLA